MPLPPVPAQIRQQLTDTTRLYRLQGQGPLAQLLVQAWIAHEALDAPWRLELLALSVQAGLDPHSLLGQRLTLWTRLADGSELPRSGIVTQARAEQADGGFARYQLTVEPWLALLAHTVRSQVAPGPDIDLRGCLRRPPASSGAIPVPSHEARDR